MARKTFSPSVRKARFVHSPYTAQEMLGFGQIIADDVKARIRRGQNVYDAPARPLVVQYARRKQRRGLNPIRDLTFTGRTLRALRPLSATENRVAVGFYDSVAAQRVAFNQYRERQFGMSPQNSQHIREALEKKPVVTVKKVA